MLHVRKDHAGSTTTGHHWPTDGAVLELPDEVALELVAIKDAGLTIVDPPPQPKRKGKTTDDDDGEG